MPIVCLDMKRTTFRLASALLPALVAIVVACGGDDDPEDAPASTATATVATATATVPAAEPSPTSAPTEAPAETATPALPETPPPPPSGSTGIDAVDDVMEAVVALDAASLEALLRFTQAECTHSFGAGGPPKCFYYQPAPPEGSIVEAFPLSTCEGEWRTDLAPIVEMLFDRDLSFYGVASLNLDGPLAGLAYYPQPEYGVLLQHEVNGESGGILLGVEDGGGITYIDYVCFAPPDWFFSDQAEVVYGDGLELIFEGPAYP